MRQTLWHHSYFRSGGVFSHGGRHPAAADSQGRPGFTLIEVIVAMTILLIVMVSVFMLIGVSATSLKNSEMLDMAKNIGTYTVEYLRSRNVTLDNNFIPIVNSNWYRPADPTATPPDLGNPSSAYPGLVDLGKSLVEKNNLTALSANTNPALASTTYTTPAFYSSLQGYVSLADNPSAAAPSLEDGNANVVAGKYYDLTTLVPYIVRFPGASGTITNFTALAGYNAMVYSSNSAYTTSSSRQYDPHYTTTKAGTTDYRGFRVLTQIAARAQTAGTHVQYYDVRVTVFWLIGSAEHSYSVATQIATYGGS